MINYRQIFQSSLPAVGVLLCLLAANTRAQATTCEEAVIALETKSKGRVLEHLAKLFDTLDPEVLSGLIKPRWEDLDNLQKALESVQQFPDFQKTEDYTEVIQKL